MDPDEVYKPVEAFLGNTGAETSLGQFVYLAAKSKYYN